MPDWMLAYVVMHELAHLEEANHGAGFWRLVNHYSLAERARGYLMALAWKKTELHKGATGPMVKPNRPVRQKTWLSKLKFCKLLVC